MVCNSRGDVEAFYNGLGTVKSRYIYDSWGNVIKVVNANGVEITNQNDVAFINPIRYRGYYYDSETGLYYLKSRYYDPEVGRFINADGYVSTGQGVLGNNMFAYCGNNPVMYSDPTGEFLGLVLGAFAIGLTMTFAGCKSDKSESYKSADAAAKAFSEQIYSSSMFIYHEYSTVIYSNTVDGKTTYNYTEPKAGSPHEVTVDISAAQGTPVAYAHTDPYSNIFSGPDAMYACKNKIDGYVVGPSRELKRFSVLTEEGQSLGLIDPIELTEAQRTSLVAEFQKSWDAHIAQGCDLGCGSMKWPVY